MGTGLKNKIFLKPLYIYLLLILLVFLFKCGTEKSFLYKWDFFQKKTGKLIYPYQLTTDIASEFQPTVSPDGKYIIYASDKSGNLDLWLYHMLNKETFKITYHMSDDTMPSFSKDGKKLVFISYRKNASGDIFQLKFKDILKRAKYGLSKRMIKSLIRNDKSIPITDDKIPQSEPIYVDNNTIYFVQPDKKGIKNIFKTKDNYKSKIYQITTQGAISPTVSPNKKYLAYVDVSKNINRSKHIILRDLSTLKEIQITSGNSIELKPYFINNNLLIYSSIRLDSNKNGKIDLNDNASLYIYNIAKKVETQLTPDNYASYYPKFSPLYNGVIIYTANLLNNIGIWMLPVSGYIPDFKSINQKLNFIKTINDDYIKLLAYKNLLNVYPNNNIKLNIAELYYKLNFSDRANTYITNLITSYSVSSNTNKEIIFKAKLLQTIYKSKNIQNTIKKLLILKNNLKNTKISNDQLITLNLKLNELYLKTKQYNKSKEILEENLKLHKVKNESYLQTIKNLILINLQFNQFDESINNILNLTNFPDFEKKINTIDFFLKKYISFSLTLDKKKVFKKLLKKFKKYKDFYYQTLLVSLDYQKNKTTPIKVLSKIIKNTDNVFFRFTSLWKLYNLTNNKQYLFTIIKDYKKINKKNLPQTIKTIYSKSEKIIVNNYLSLAKSNFNKKKLFNAKKYYNNAISINQNNIPALTGNLNCDIKLLKFNEKKYEKLMSKFDALLKKNPYNHTYHYLKGYGYSLIYSIFYIKYNISLKKISFIHI